MLRLAKTHLAGAQSQHSVHVNAQALLLLQPTANIVQANAVSLSAELPQIEGGTQRVLYPSSAKAGSDLQVGSGSKHSAL